MVRAKCTGRPVFTMCLGNPAALRRTQPAVMRQCKHCLTIWVGTKWISQKKLCGEFQEMMKSFYIYYGYEGVEFCGRRPDCVNAAQLFEKEEKKQRHATKKFYKKSRRR